MSHTPHELAEEFPQQVEALHRLKQENAHFAKLFDSYHNVNPCHSPRRDTGRTCL